MRAVELLLVEHEVGALAPPREQALAEAGALDALEPVAGDDLVGVDVGAVQRHRGARHDLHGFHGSPQMSCPLPAAQARSAGVANVPAMAVAAATSGDTRW